MLLDFKEEDRRLSYLVISHISSKACNVEKHWKESSIVKISDEHIRVWRARKLLSQAHVFIYWEGGL
jgi:hypothetical protein